MDEIPALGNDEAETVVEESKDIELRAFSGESFLAPEIQLFGKCRLLIEFEKMKKMGEGSYGSVYQVMDKKNDSILAMKWLKLEPHEMFLPIDYMREITIIKELHHENIIQYLGVAVGKNFDSTYLLLEYCPYELAKVVDDEEAKVLVKHPQIKCIMQQLFMGLDYLKRKFILHRDLTMTNILFTEAGVLKIADFGCARKELDRKMTPNVVSRWYRAPEILFGARIYTTAIDMWSAGCIFAELLLKEPLFKAETDNGLISLLVETLGAPNEIVWPGFSELPIMKIYDLSDQPYNRLTLKFSEQSPSCIALLHKLFVYNPSKRITAHECLTHSYFNDKPPACNLESLVAVLKRADEV